MADKNILIVGIFLSRKTKNKIPRSVPDLLAELFTKNDKKVLTASIYVNRILRLIDTFYTIVFLQKKYDVAIVPWFNGKGSYLWQEIACRLLRSLDKKIILEMHGGGLADLIDENPKKYLRSLKRADVIVCPSSFFSERLKKFKLPTLIIRNSLDLSEYPLSKKNNSELTLLWMRTLEDIYNPGMALQVGKILKNKNYPFTMYVAGKDNGQLKDLIKVRDELNLTGEIQFTGLIDHARKIELANKSDIYISTNKVDNAPVSVIEMMAMGLPVVSTNVGGIPYLINDGHNGYLVESNDAEAMADRILELHITPSLTQKLIKNGLTYSRQFDEKIIFKKWMDCIAAVRAGEPVVSVEPRVAVITEEKPEVKKERKIEVKKESLELSDRN